MLISKIDKALENQTRHTLIDKSGRYYHGLVTDSWVRVSGAKMRGKIKFQSDEKGELEMDANDILDLTAEKTV